MSNFSTVKQSAGFPADVPWWAQSLVSYEAYPRSAGASFYMDKDAGAADIARKVIGVVAPKIKSLLGRSKSLIQRVKAPKPGAPAPKFTGRPGGNASPFLPVGRGAKNVIPGAVQVSRGAPSPTVIDADYRVVNPSWYSRLFDWAKSHPKTVGAGAGAVGGGAYGLSQLWGGGDTTSEFDKPYQSKEFQDIAHRHFNRRNINPAVPNLVGAGLGGVGGIALGSLLDLPWWARLALGAGGGALGYHLSKNSSYPARHTNNDSTSVYIVDDYGLDKQAVNFNALYKMLASGGGKVMARMRGPNMLAGVLRGTGKHLGTAANSGKLLSKGVAGSADLSQLLARMLRHYSRIAKKTSKSFSGVTDLGRRASKSVQNAAGTLDDWMLRHPRINTASNIGTTAGGLYGGARFLFGGGSDKESA